MGLFGSGSKTTKTTVKPSKEVDALLKRVAGLANNYDSGEFVKRQTAEITPEMQAALKGLSGSQALKNIAGTYSPRTEKGLGQLSNINANLQNLVSQGKISGQQALDYRNAITGSPLAQRANAQAASASLGGNKSAALRRQGAVGTQRNQAMTNLGRNQAALGLGIGNLQNAQSMQLRTAGQMGNLAGTNLNLGAAGTQAGQQALANQLAAGNYMQAYNQNRSDVDWQNQMGQQQFGWNQLNNKLNVLNTISPMAGYTTTGATPGISTGQQLAGYGTAALGALGNRYFSSGAQAARANGVGGMQSMQAQTANNAQGYTMPQQNNGGFFSNLGQGFGQYFSAH